MGLKGAGPYFQRSMSSKVLAGLVYRICELYIDDDVLIHGATESDFIANVRKVFERLREHNVAVNPRKTKLGLPQVEYVGHLVTADGISFTEEKRLKILDFPKPTNEKQIQMFIGLANYFRDHVPNMTEIIKPLRDMFSPKSIGLPLEHRLSSFAKRQYLNARSYTSWQIRTLPFFRRMHPTMESGGTSTPYVTVRYG